MCISSMTFYNGKVQYYFTPLPLLPPVYPPSYLPSPPPSPILHYRQQGLDAAQF